MPLAGIGLLKGRLFFAQAICFGLAL